MSAKRIIISTNTSEFFISHRLHLALHARKKGFEVIVLAPKSEATQKILDLGFEYYELPMSRKGMNPFSEVKVIWSYYKAFKELQPDIYHAFTIKPVIYGALAAQLTGVKKIIASITGLGYIFLRKDFAGKIRKFIVGLLYKLALKNNNTILVFQNTDDEQLFLNNSYCDTKQVHIIPGTGVDTTQFTYKEEPLPPIRILFPARFLIDKGFPELIRATKLLAKEKKPFQLVLCGKIDPGNPASIDQDSLDQILKIPFIEYDGYSTNMNDAYSNAHIVCLPSHREGIPLALLEAASCGRPIVTTDAPGCREVVQHNENGFLVPVASPNELANALRILIESPDRRKSMGLKSRQIAERQFSKDQVLEEFINLYDN